VDFSKYAHSNYLKIEGYITLIILNKKKWFYVFFKAKKIYTIILEMVNLFQPALDLTLEPLKLECGNFSA